MPSIRLGVIGYGERCRHMSALIVAQDVDARLAAIADPKHETIREELIAAGRDVSDMRFYTTADEMLEMEPLDGVIIGTRCSQHTEMALKVLGRGLAVFLEKPISTNMADLNELRAASCRSR